MARRENDFYPTGEGKIGVPWAAQALYSRLPQIHGIAEPCVGTGDLIRGRERHVLWTNDIDEQRQAGHHFDAADQACWIKMARPEWVVTNPPFNKAHLVLANALGHAVEGVAMLLRLSFLEPTEARARLLVECPPRRLIVLPRISFTGDGKTDSVTCAWMVWDHDDMIEPGIEIVPVSERDPHRREQLTLTKGKP